MSQTSSNGRNLDLEDDDRLIGPGKITQYLLAIWPDQFISRATIRAFLPEGRRLNYGAQKFQKRRAQGETGGVNSVSVQLKEMLRKLEKLGAIQRGEEFIHIKDRRLLMDRALSHITNPNHPKFLEAATRAAEIVRAQIDAEDRDKVRAQRVLELRHIRELMIPASLGNRDARRRLVRLESGAISVPLGATTGSRPPVDKSPTFPVIQISRDA